MKLLLLLLTTSLVSTWSPVLAIPPSSRPQKDLGRVFDYVIVGGGPGGLTVANRLSENPSVSVAVIEAGTFYEDVVGNQSQVPGYDFRYNGKSPNYTIPFVDWGFLTTPQAVRLVSLDSSQRRNWH